MSEETKKPVGQIQFDYLQSKDFRVIIADGAIGSFTPTGRLLFSLYNERAALPRSVIQKVNENGELGEIISTESRPGIVRWMEVAVEMDRPTLQAFKSWIDIKLTEMDQLFPQESKKVG